MTVQLVTSFEAAQTKGVSARFVGLTSASSQRSPTGASPCQGLYWTADGHSPKLAFVLTHYNGDFSEHYSAGPLAARGYGVLGWNTRYRGNEDAFILENALDDISAGVTWLKKEAGVEKIILIGNSGGGSLLTAYQARAQKDPSLVAGDAFIYLNAHAGRPHVFTRLLDPSVVDETDPIKTDSSLDMYDPANKPPYSPEFVKRYRAAQLARNQRITDWARQELKRLNNAGIDDRVFTIFRSMADLRFNDPTIDPSDRPCPASFLGDPEKANRNIPLWARVSTLKSWLSMWSMEASKSKFELYVAELSLPTLVIQSTKDIGLSVRDARAIFERLTSKDKELTLVPGAHFFDDSQKSLDGVVDVIDLWVKARF